MPIPTLQSMNKKKPFELLIATGNQGKIRELRDLLSNTKIELKSLEDFTDIEEVEETGATFAENAVLKARGYALQTGLPTLADDSGLEVGVLGGAPGVYSARYAGTNAVSGEKIAKLLGEIAETGSKNRAARFVCVIAVADGQGNIKFQAEGVCPGKIAFKTAGEHGFGYDPIFIPQGYGQTFGELDGQIKRKISHRALAFEKIIRFLDDFNPV